MREMYRIPIVVLLYMLEIPFESSFALEEEILLDGIMLYSQDETVPEGYLAVGKLSEMIQICEESRTGYFLCLHGGSRDENESLAGKMKNTVMLNTDEDVAVIYNRIMKIFFSTAEMGCRYVDIRF